LSVLWALTYRTREERLENDKERLMTINCRTGIHQAVAKDRNQKTVERRIEKRIPFQSEVEQQSNVYLIFHLHSLGHSTVLRVLCPNLTDDP